MYINEINKFLKSVLDPECINDYAINGIQVENDRPVKKIGFTVDASLEAIKLLIENHCDLLIVHHGFYWGKVLPVAGNYRQKLKMLLENDIGLIAYHLPLDAHEEYGNNIQILKAIGFDKIDMFAGYKGTKIGWYCENEKSLAIEEIIKRIGINGSVYKYLNFGKNEIKTIGVVSGGGNFCFDEVVSRGFDLFITGDADHIIYHNAKENNVNVLFGGHYFTETFGVKALKKLIEKQFNLECEFFDIPTGL